MDLSGAGVRHTMSIELLFQNRDTGELWELSTVTKSISYKTVMRGAPSSLELEIQSDLAFPYGSPIILKNDTRNLFRGYLFKVKKGKHGKRTLVFFDQIKYLLRSSTFVLKNKNLAQIVSAIAKDFELETGALNAPNTVLPTLLKEDKTALDIIQECLDETLVKTGRLCVFFDEAGKLRLDEPHNMRIYTVLADMSIISDFEYEGSIEDSANIVKLVHDNKKTGKRDVYYYQDSNNIKKWGKLQYFKKMDEKANEAQIKQMGEMYLKLKNKPKETINLSFSVGDFDFRGGRSVFVDVKDIGASGWYVLDEVTHTITAGSHSMDVKLFIASGGA